MNSESSMQPTAASEPLAKTLAEPYAFALVTWPAVIGLMIHLPHAWAGYARLALALWLAAMHVAAYTHGRGRGFGNIMLFNSVLVALACSSYPSSWTLAWLSALLIGLHAAQRARLNTMPRPIVADTPGTAAMPADAGENP